MTWTLPLALSLVDNPKRNGSNTSWKARCPAHNDSSPSLSLTTGETQELILRCHAGCEYSDIMGQLTDRLKAQTTIYTYHDTNGIEIGRVHKSYDSEGKKKFYQSVPNGKGEWVRGSSEKLKNTPYALPRLLQAIEKQQQIFIVEGEKDADRLIGEGRAATCNVGGVGMQWKDSHSQWLKDANRIFIISDDDGPGKKHAWNTFESLHSAGVTARISVVISSVANDISDHLDLGHSLKDLIPLEQTIERDDRIVSGAAFIFDTPADVPAIWGNNGKKVLWAEGQGLTIMAPQGVGKTTLGILLVEARLGLSSEVLDMPVQPSKKGVLFMAMDRPIQIASAMRRTFEKHGRESVAAQRLHVWRGPPEHDLGRHPGSLLELCLSLDVDTVVIDALKDAVMRLSSEESGQGWNTAVQLCLMQGIQVCVLNHPTKHTGTDLTKPVSLDDVYGSGWITAGMGSVLSLWGERNSAFAELTQLKYPADALDPITISRHGKTGEMTVIGNSLDWAWFFLQPRTVVELQSEMFPNENNKPNYNKAKRQVDDLVSRGVIVKHSETLPGQAAGRSANRYILRTPE